MPTQLSPLTVRIQATGSRETRGEINKTAGSFNLIVSKAQQADKAVGKSGREIAMAAREARQMDAAMGKTADTTGGVSKRMGQVARETGDASREARTLAQRVGDAGNRFRELADHSLQTAKNVHKAWDIVSAFRKGGPLKIFSAIVPEEIKRSIGKGMLAGGVTLAAMLGSTVGPAMTKQSQLTAIEALAGNNKGAADQIYKSTDAMSTTSVFNLPELVDAAKTLTKDRQFSERLLKAADDLAATDTTQFSPVDIARAMGRIRAGETGEGLERLRDAGLSRLDLEEKGIKFDGGGAVADKTPEGITRLIEAITKTIEERFGGLSDRLATTTLEGSISNAQDAVGRLRTEIGENFIPVLNYGATTIRALAEWIGTIPEPIKKVLVWGTAFTAGLLLIGGGILFLSGFIAKIIFVMNAIKVANFVLGLFGTSITQLAIQHIVPSILRMAAAGALLAIIAAATYVAVKGSQDAMKMSNAELEVQWGALGKFWSKAAQLLDKVLNHPLFKAMFGGAYAAARAVGLVDGNKDKGDAAAEKSRQITNAARKKRGLKPIGKDEFEASQQTQEETVAEVRARRAKAGQTGNALTDLQNSWAKKFGGGSIPVAPGALSGVGGVALSGGYGLPSMMTGNEGVDAAQGKVDSIAAEIAELQDRKRNASKEEKKVIADQVAEAGRRLKAAKRDLAAAKKRAGQGEKDAKEAEQEAARAAERSVSIRKMKMEGRADGEIAGLEIALQSAQEANNAALVRALTSQISSKRALLAYRSAMMDAALQKDKAERRFMERTAALNYQGAIAKGSRDAGAAGGQIEKSNAGRVRDDARMLARVDAEIATNEKIEGLQSQLDAARDAENSARVRALTLQIDSARANADYEQAMAEAATETDAGHRRTLEQIAKKRRDAALRGAQRAAEKAAADVEKSADKKGKKKGEGASNLSDSAIRARMAMMRGAAQTMGGSALGSGIGYGDRFAEADQLRGRYEASPLRSFQSYNTMPDRTMDIGALGVPTVAGDNQARVASQRQNERGNIVVKFDELEIEFPRIGDLRGRMNGRR